MAELTKQTPKSRSRGGDLNKPRIVAKLSVAFVGLQGDQVMLAFDEEGGDGLRYTLMLTREEWDGWVTSRPELFRRPS